MRLARGPRGKLQLQTTLGNNNSFWECSQICILYPYMLETSVIRGLKLSATTLLVLYAVLILQATDLSSAADNGTLPNH